MGDEGGRARRPPEDGLPRAQHAHADPRRARRDQAHRRASTSISTPSRSTTPKTYKLFCDGQTYGVFQFESSGMRELLRKAKPERLDDLIALNALYRPGPLKSGMVDDFIARKQGRTEVKYELAAARADPVRHLRRHRVPGTGHAHRGGRWPASRWGSPTCCARPWGRRTPRSWPSSARPSWPARAPRGSTRRRPTKIFDLMEFFAGYGFNKSHSTTYAWIAYQTGYLKANYPAALHGRAADDRGGQHRQARDVSRASAAISACRSCRRTSTRASWRSPSAPKACASASAPSRTSARARSSRCSASRKEQGPIRLALHAVRARGPPPGQQARPREPDQGRRARFAGRPRRCAGGRAAPGSSPPSTGPSSTAAAISAIATRDSTSCSAIRSTTARPYRCALPDAPGWPESQQLAFEKEALGLYMSGHPLERFAEEMKAFGARRVARARRVGGGRLGRRHRLWPAPAQDQEGRPHGRLHAGRRGGSGRGRGVPRDVRQARLAHRGRRDAAGPRQVREGRGVGAARRDRADADGGAERADDARGGDPPVASRRTAGRSSRRSRSSCRGIAAIAGSTWSSTSRDRSRRCACAPTSRSGSGRPSGWSPKSSSCAGGVGGVAMTSQGPRDQAL